MIIGNEKMQDTLRDLLSRTITGSLVLTPFIIVHGESHIGKSSFVSGLIPALLGQFSSFDFLHIKDFSDIIRKHHPLKVAYSDTELSDTLEKEYHYRDFWVRDISDRLQKSAAGQAKIVFIENIERMAPSAANAFLKTVEEPLQGRIIVATSSMLSDVLPTLLSRAFLLPFYVLPDSDITTYITHNQLFAAYPWLQSFAVRLAMGRPGILHYLHDRLDDDVLAALQLFSSTDIYPLSSFYSALQTLHKKWLLDLVLDAYIAILTERHDHRLEQWLSVKKMLESPVNVDALLLYGLLS